MANKKGTIMEKEINKNGKSWGRLMVVIPMEAKLKIMRWQLKSGMRKAEFLRGALLVGANSIATQTGAKDQDESYFDEK
jgi:hypothetical protein